MSSSAILRPDILVVGNRSYRVNPSSLPGLEPVTYQADDVYREEEESDYYPRPDPNEDEPSCKIQVARTTTEADVQPKTGISESMNDDLYLSLSVDRIFFCSSHGRTR